MPVYVHMGHSNAIECVRKAEDDDNLEVRDLPGERIFELVFPDEKLTMREMVMTTMATFRKHQRAGHEDGKDVIPPDWVRSNNAGLQEELISEYGLGKNEIPAGYGTEYESFKRLHMPSLTALSALQAALYVPMAILGAWALFKLTRLQLRTTAGRDYQANILGNTASNGTGAYNPATYIGLTADNTAPAAGDTTLPGEIVSGTLIRAIGAFAHTTGASSYTVSKLFVSDQSVTINKIGVFNALTGGTLFVETSLSPAANLNSGDQLQIVSTITL